MFADQVLEKIDRLGFGNIELHWGTTDIEIDLPWSSTDVAEIGIGHFAGAIDDAPHDGDFYALEMSGRLLNFSGGGLEIKERASATRASDIVSFEGASAGGLEEIKAHSQELTGAIPADETDGIADPIAKEGAEMRGGLEKIIGEVRWRNGFER